MKFYTVYSKKIGKEDSYILVKDGFNWHSLFFSIFWALYKKTWKLVGLYILVIMSCMALIKLGYSPKAVEILRWFFIIGLGFYANDFYRSSLVKNGYKLIDVSASQDETKALVKFLDKQYKSG